MKKGIFKKIAAGLLGGLMCFTMLPKAPSHSFAASVGDTLSVGNGSQNQHKGNCDGYSYEVWIDTTGGGGSMTLGEGASFKAEWNATVSSGNFLARRGLDFGSQKKATDYSYIGLDYEADYRQTGSQNGNSRLCVYGWFQNKNAGNVPLVEYYIIEDWVDWCPDGNGKLVTIDGAQYKIFQLDHTGPTINGGSETFKQYFSVRQDKRTSGHITVSDHFKAWANEGWGIGNLYEVALNAEGWQSSGVADVKKLDVYTDPDKRDPDIGGGDDPIEVEPDENGYFFHSDFESDTDSWVARGEASVNMDSSKNYEGNKSLYVTGRTDSWNGAARSLSTSAFVPGNSYSFSAMAMQNVTASENFKLTLQYTKDGEENYDTIASAAGAKDEWVQLANTSYTIPSGATNLLIYVETEDSTTNFYMDEAVGAKEGTVVSADKKYALGDVNCDGKIDSADLQELQSFILGREADVYPETSDMNGDGRVNSFDLVILRKTVLEKASEPVTPPDDPTVNNGVDISWIDTSKPMVAISFDDGAVGTASNSSSMRILNALSGSGFHSTFFYVGNWINSGNQDEVKKAYDMGMEIANHTNSHPYLTNLSASEIRSEYDTCAQKLKNIIGTEPSKLIRLPYLSSNSTVQSALYDAPLITCSIDTQDWNGASSDQIINTVKNAMSNGSLDNAIVLCHETYDTTAEAMEYLCPYLKSQGWQIVTVSELFAANGKELNGGQLYTKCN